MTHRTKLAWEVITFKSSFIDRDLSVRVNREVDHVRSWCDYPDDVRVASLTYVHQSDTFILTMEYHIKVAD